MRLSEEERRGRRNFLFNVTAVVVFPPLPPSNIWTEGGGRGEDVTFSSAGQIRGKEGATGDVQEEEDAWT